MIDTMMGDLRQEKRKERSEKMRVCKASRRELQYAKIRLASFSGFQVWPLTLNSASY